jgi:hypothetical protein
VLLFENRINNAASRAYRVNASIRTCE